MRIALLCFTMLLFSCSEEEKAIETVINEVERGAVLRTVEIRNGEFDINDLSAEFNILLEQQDIEDGDSLERVEILLSFVDNTPENGDQSVNSFVYETWTPSDFSRGENQLPVIDVIHSFEALLEAVNLQVGDVRCKDQFRLDLTIYLTDDRTFNTLNAAGAIVNDSGFFLSPFSYLVNIVEPIDTQMFTGTYLMEQTQVGSRGNTFVVDESFVALAQGHSNNVRVINLISDTIGDIDLDISFVCDEVIATRYQKTILPNCTALDSSDQILLGPDSPSGITDPLDDTVFELYLLEGFEGFNTGCPDFINVPAKFRFTKQ